MCDCKNNGFMFPKDETTPTLIHWIRSSIVGIQNSIKEHKEIEAYESLDRLKSAYDELIQRFTKP